MKPYSQTKAIFAITKASLRAIFRSPPAVNFGFAFPLIFLLFFGFIGGVVFVGFRAPISGVLGLYFGRVGADSYRFVVSRCRFDLRAATDAHGGNALDLGQRFARHARGHRNRMG